MCLLAFFVKKKKGGLAQSFFFFFFVYLTKTRLAGVYFIQHLLEAIVDSDHIMLTWDPFRAPYN